MKLNHHSRQKPGRIDAIAVERADLNSLWTRRSHVQRLEVKPLHRRGAARRSLGQRAFTLVELLLVLVILGILAALVLPKFTGRTEQARITAAVTQISTFGTALDAFEVDTGSYPRGQDGLNQLLVQPPDVPNWRGPYLKSDIPLDPWGHPYTYEFPGRVNPRGYDIVSMGPDGQAGTADDVVNASITAK